ncbi:MAG: DUF3943 domain-containing protein [Thermodesulfobacteriota bacterium]
MIRFSNIALVFFILFILQVPSRAEEQNASSKQEQEHILRGENDTSALHPNKTDQRPGEGTPFQFPPEGITAQPKYYLRAATELVLALGVTAAIYYSPEGRKRNENDWQYPFNRETLKKKLFSLDTVRFDNNAADINLGHAAAGTGYYLLARGNGLNALESFIGTFAASSLWETLGEIREVYSINDQMVTTMGGVVFGEVLYQIGEYLRYGPVRSPWRNFLAAVFDPGTALNNWLNDFSPRRSGTKALPYHQGKKARFDIYAGGEQIKEVLESKGVVTFGLETEIQKNAFFDQPGQSRGLYKDTVLTLVQVQYWGGKKKNPDDLMLRTKAVFGAYHLKDIRDEAGVEKNGYSLMIGPSSALDFKVINRPQGGGWISNFELLGPSLEAVFYKGGWKFRVGADLFGDFAMIQSQALRQFRRKYGAEGLAGVQSKEGDKFYYYGVGLSESLRFSAAYGPLEVGGFLQRSDFKDLRGRDLVEEKITRRLTLRDTLTEMELKAAYRLRQDLTLETYVNRTRWASKAEGLYFSEREIHYGMRLRFSFN